jgi:Transposase DDE domain
MALSEQMMSKHSIQLWKLSSDKQQFNRFRDMLNGSLVNGIDVAKLQVSQLASSSVAFAGCSYVVLVHDGCDIRKPHSTDLEYLGWVRDLSGKWVRGYQTMNSVCVDMQSKEVRLLRCTPYSSAEADFVGQGELKKYETGQIKDKARREEIERLLATGLAKNGKKILLEHIQVLHEAIRAENPDALIIHVLDRYHDDQEVFSFIAELGDYFVIRLRKNHYEDAGEELLSLADLAQEVSQTYRRLSHLDKTYTDIRACYAWGTWQQYSVIRVTLYQKSGQRLFKEPMLLVSNLEIPTFLMAFLIFELYLHRWKIESVFRFLKQSLGWEEFLIQDWESIRNLIALAFFIGGYFYEIQDQLTEDKTLIWLAELGGGKGKVTRGYILAGIAKVVEAKQTQDFLQKNNISEEEINRVRKRFFLSQ